MNQYKKRLNQLLELTTGEKRGMMAFLVLMVIIAVVPKIYVLYFKSEIHLEELEKRVLEVKKELDSNPNQKLSDKALLTFDPNTASEQDLIQLGFSVQIARRIIKYRNSGGSFKHADDMKKIYGLDEKQFKRIESYISIVHQSAPKNQNRSKHKKKEVEVMNIDLNRSDSADFITLKGIGPIYASRIVKYRNLLGGYIDKEQLREVYGISDSLYSLILNYVSVDTSVSIQRISINKVSVADLRHHPYFRSYSICNAIVNYRTQHGDYKGPSDLTRVHVISDSILDRISPYISYN